MDQWIPILSLVVAALGVVVGPLIGWRLARDRNEHERQMALEERRQRRREDLYIDIIAHVFRVVKSVELTMPHLGVEDLEGPKMPTEDEKRLFDARVRAIGSPEVQGLLRDLDRTVDEFWRVAGLWLPTKEWGTEEAVQALWRDAEERRQPVRDAAEAIAARVREELAGLVATT